MFPYSGIPTIFISTFKMLFQSRAYLFETSLRTENSHRPSSLVRTESPQADPHII